MGIQLGAIQAILDQTDLNGCPQAAGIPSMRCTHQVRSLRTRIVGVTNTRDPTDDVKHIAGCIEAKWVPSAVIGGSSGPQVESKWEQLLLIPGAFASQWVPHGSFK